MESPCFRLIEPEKLPNMLAYQLHDLYFTIRFPVAEVDPYGNGQTQLGCHDLGIIFPQNSLRRFTKGYYIKQPNMDCQPTEFTALSRHRAVFSWAGKGGIPICGA